MKLLSSQLLPWQGDSAGGAGNAMDGKDLARLDADNCSVFFHPCLLHFERHGNTGSDLE